LKGAFTHPVLAQLMGPSRTESLTDAEKIDIIHLHLNGLGPVAISRDMTRSEKMIRTFDFPPKARQTIPSLRKTRAATPGFPHWRCGNERIRNKSSIDSPGTELNA
jgi:hypothetical protein